MAVVIHQIRPVAHLPLVLGVLRKLQVAALIDTFCAPHPANVLSCGRGVEALLLAILDGHHALYKVGARLEERGMLSLLQDGLERASLNDYRLGQILDALFAAQLTRVFGAIALNTLEVYAIATPWLHQDTTTISLYGAYEEEVRPVAGLVPPRPAYGHSKDGRDDLKQVLLSLGVSSEGLPLRMGLRDGNTSDSTETPVAIEECLALGLDGVHGIVADSKAYCKRTLGLCLEQGVGLITLVPRTCAVRQALEAWGQQHGPLPLLLEKPGRTRREAPRRWHGRSVVRQVEVEYADGRRAMEDLRLQCPRTFYTDLDTLICKMRQPIDLQGEQYTSRRGRPVIAWHAPDGPLQGQRPQDQSHHGNLTPLLTATRIHLGDPALPWVIDTRVGHLQVLRVLDPHQIVIYPDLHRVAPQVWIHIQPKVMQANLAMLADRARQLAQP
jgi:Domain of unknown function (DUF4277)